MKKVTLMGLFFTLATIFQVQAQSGPIILSQTDNSEFLTEGVSCGDGGDNSWYRSYALSDDGITFRVNLAGVQFVVGSMEAETEFSVHAYSYEGFPVNFDASAPPEPIASTKITVALEDINELIRVNFDKKVCLPVGSSIVIKLVKEATPYNIYLATAAQETKSSYISSEVCGINEMPVSVEDLGFEEARHIINLVLTDDVLGTDTALMDNIKIYPNPTQGDIHLKLPGDQQVLEIELYDVLGKRIQVEYINETLGLGTVSPGVYTLKLKTSQGELIRKIVKQ